MSDMCREGARNSVDTHVQSCAVSVFISVPLPVRRRRREFGALFGNMVFEQCVSYHLAREELAYDVAVDAAGSVAVGRVPVGPREYTCSCK